MAFCEAARVLDARYLTPGMIRIRVQAMGEWRWPTSGIGDETIDLAFPRPGEAEVDIAYFNTADYGTKRSNDEPPWRHYTVRAVHEQGAVLDIDFVVHPGGTASEWATRAQPGQVLGVFTVDAPRSYYAPPAGARNQLLVADSTGLPGLGRIVEGLPHGSVAHAIIEVPSEADRQQLASEATLTVDWLIGTGLGRSLSALPAAVADWAAPAGLDYAWIACEAAASRRIRSHLRSAIGLERSRHIAVGYWTDGHTGHFEQDERGAQPRLQHDADHDHDHEHDHEHDHDHDHEHEHEHEHEEPSLSR